MKKAFICISFLLSVLAFQTAGVEIKGLGQVNYVFSDNATSWFDNGTSILAYSESSPNIQQAILRVTDSYPNGLSYKVVANYYQTGKQHLGLTQMQLAYKPFVVSESFGAGEVIAFTQDPTVRAYLDGLNVMLMNAIFRGSAHARPVR